MAYFSEKELGERPRQDEEIRDGAWGGIRALIRSRIEDGSFGASYPQACEEGRGPVGTEETGFWHALRAEVPSLEEGARFGIYEEMPGTLEILDTIEFCWRCVGDPIRDGYHEFFGHHHLRFDVENGRERFREGVNRIFRRNGLAYELSDRGRIERLAAPVLREDLGAGRFKTGDPELDGMLETARQKFLDPDEATRREALQILWDAWERLKTLGSGRDKAAQATSLLDSAAGSASSRFRLALEREARELNWIGNNLQIRHSEKNQDRIARSEHVDYLFHRLFCILHMSLRMGRDA